MYKKNENYGELALTLYQNEGQKIVDVKAQEWTSIHSDLENDRRFENTINSFDINKIASFIEEFCFKTGVFCKRLDYSNFRSTIMIFLKYSRIHIFLPFKTGFTSVDGNICFGTIFHTIPENYHHLCSLIRNVLNDEKNIDRMLSDCKQKAIRTAKMKEITYKSIAVLVQSLLKDHYSWKLNIISNTNPQLVINKNSNNPFVIDIDETNFVNQIMELATKLHGEK